MSGEAPIPMPGAGRRPADPDRSAGVRWGLLGLFVGAVFGQSAWAAVSGAAIGAVWGVWRTTTRRAAALETAFARFEARIDALERGSALAAEPMRADAPVPVPLPPVPPAPAPSVASAPRPPPRVEPAPATHRAPPAPPGPTVAGGALAAVRGFFLGGNTVVRVGILVLLIGVALLAKWAVDHALFPVEARLAAAASIGFALAVVGYRLRDARPGFATTLQGGGVAALYLVVFFAYRVFALVPAPLAFALFIAIALACGTLAVVQKSQPLIFIGSVGGFLAPILASTGEGNHVVLFSYYLLLDLGIAAAAFRENWRALNLLAFIGTYAVATLWGVLRYRPEHFASTEPFLLTFLVLFTGTALVRAWRQPTRSEPQASEGGPPHGQGGRLESRPTRSEPQASEGGPPHGLVDGTLVFGTPLVTLLAQARLVEGLPFGMAFSTAGFGLFYAVLATWVWRRGPETLRRIAEAFVALAVVFGTIAIPLGLDDGLTTTLAWSLEGAGLYWVGTRQRRRLPRLSGVALQGLAALAYTWAARLDGFTNRSEEFVALANPRFLSGIGIAFAGLFIAREAYALRERLHAAEWQLAQVLAAWGLLWWAGACALEIDQFAPRAYEVTGGLLVIAATTVALERAAAALRWRPGRMLALGVIPAGFLALVVALDQQAHLLGHGGLFAWPLLLLCVYHVLRRLEGCGVGWTAYAYAPALWLCALVTALGLSGATAVTAGLGGDWPIAAFGVGLASVQLVANAALERRLGPFGRFPSVHLRLGAAPLAALAVSKILALNLLARGDATPLPYLPLLDPADVAIALLFLAVLDGWIRLQRIGLQGPPGAWRSWVGPGLVGLVFVWGNGVLVRSVYQWTDVPFWADALWDSTPLQAALSISWTLVALGGMLWCTKRGWRTRWIAAATLLGVTVAKLFLVDLSTLSTGAKIGTFLVVGVLLLVVGYLSPVPPAVAPAIHDAEGRADPEGGHTR